MKKFLFALLLYPSFAFTQIDTLRSMPVKLNIETKQKNRIEKADMYIGLGAAFIIGSSLIVGMDNEVLHKEMPGALYIGGAMIAVGTYIHIDVFRRKKKKRSSEFY